MNPSITLRNKWASRYPSFNSSLRLKLRLELLVLCSGCQQFERCKCTGETHLSRSRVTL